MVVCNQDEAVSPCYIDDRDAVRVIPYKVRYKELSASFRSIFHSQLYERLVLAVVLSNSAYLMTYNTSLRSAETERKIIEETLQNSTGIFRWNSSLFVGWLATNYSNTYDLGNTETRSLSTDSWWHIFFLLDLLGQQASEGSFAEYAAKGDNVVEIAITIGTTTALIVDLCTRTQQGEADVLKILHSLAIFRLIRATKVSFLQPL